ncbi:MAG: very short patch repair endonuclease, partial [Spirochaetaceae bacterium]|nr:very short patch repair endonuclease [Spirochaetaceae bacterium]
YSDYWQKKIRRNIARDEKVTEYYKNINWTILRFWTSETKDNLNKCIVETIETINKTKQVLEKLRN